MISILYMYYILSHFILSVCNNYFFFCLLEFTFISYIYCTHLAFIQSFISLSIPWQLNPWPFCYLHCCTVSATGIMTVCMILIQWRKTYDHIRKKITKYLWCISYRECRTNISLLHSHEHTVLSNAVLLLISQKTGLTLQSCNPKFQNTTQKSMIMWSKLSRAGRFVLWHKEYFTVPYICLKPQ